MESTSARVHSFSWSLPVRHEVVAARRRQRNQEKAMSNPLKIGLAAVWAASLLLGGVAAAKGEENTCEKIAGLQLEACKAEATDDLLNAKANCLNLGSKSERTECTDDAQDDAKEAKRDCREQNEAREDLCEALGENRYEPDFDPANFDQDFSNLEHPNPYFPLATGNTWQYEGPDETISIEVLAKTKLIEGVTCAVVRDVVESDGLAVEDTDDWFAQRDDGSVVYCGEISKNFEVFEGDDPEEAELVDVEGSWKAGRDGALPGVVFQGTPVVGAIYRQELSLGDAEDAAEVLSTTYAYGSNATLDAFVPAALAQTLCANSDCIVTGEFSPLSPDGFERKYYARGVGLFLEVDPDDGDIVALTDCNFATVCNDLD